MRRHWIALVVALLLAACGANGGGETEGSSGEGGGEEAAAEGDTTGVTDSTIKIGAYAGQSGPIAETAELMTKGWTLAFDLANEAGGVHGRQIELTVGDDRYEPAQAASVVRRLVERDQVFAVTGVGTPVTLAVYEYLDEQGVPLLFPMAGARDLIEPPRETVFMSHPEYETQGYLAAKWALENRDISKIGIVYQDDDSGRDHLAGVTEAAEEAGAELVAAEAFERGTVEFGPQIAAMRQGGAEAVYTATPLSESAILAKESHRLGYNPQFVGFTTQADATLVELAGEEAVQGFLALDLLTEKGATPEMEEFQAAWEEQYPNDDITFFSHYAFFAGRLMVDALEKAGENLTRERLIEVLEGWDSHQTGLAGPVAFAEDDRNGLVAAKVVELQGTEFVPISDFVERE
jgi:branched-chain amino acid transport system substrate-binding protein